MELFYSPNLSQLITLTTEESKHIYKVMRKRKGDKLLFTNGKGIKAIGKIIKIEKNKTYIEITKKEKKEKTHNYYLHLGISPTKNTNRFEWLLEKATEIGIDEITPIISEKSEKQTIKKERCSKILISAIKQSNQYHLPILNNPINLKEFLKKTYNFQKYIAHCNNKIFKSELKSEKLLKKSIILIGPEGDFTSNEIEIAQDNNYKSISLGENRLRTETAAIIATSIINIKN